MFSECMFIANPALSQSQSRISNFVQPADNTEASLALQNERYRRNRQSFRNSSRVYPLRHGGLYPASSHRSEYNFTSLYSTAPDAPLFHSALDDFREENEEEERERETADFFALQKSRRVFASTQLEESSETQAEASHESLDTSRDEEMGTMDGKGRIRGIKSSWIGAGYDSRGTRNSQGANAGHGFEREQDINESLRMNDIDGKDMEEIVLGSNVEADNLSGDFHFETSADHNPPAFQNFRSTTENGTFRLPSNKFQENFATEIPRPPSSITVMPPTMSTPFVETPRHDVFWGSLYLICLGGMFATFFLVFLHTETPETSLGDTIYTALYSSFYLFAVDTVVSIFVSLLWLALLKSYVRPLVYLILIAVPTILFSFSLHPFISSFKNASSRLSIQGKALRWLSLFPAIFAFIWLYTIYRGRYFLSKAIGILEFASKILAANPGLLAMGFTVLASVVLWTWLWLCMFIRVFLGGKISSTFSKFVIDGTSWWLGVYFILMYIWTLSVISGIQRSTTAATVSQWYFHRLIQPSPSSREMVITAFMHAVTTLFGTISLSTLIALIIRLPLLILPRRITGIITMVVYSWIPTPISALTNPLSLTYAAIHSEPLQTSARGLSQISFLTSQGPTTTLTPHSFNTRNHQDVPLLSYRLARLLLHAARFIMAISLGFGGWVATAKELMITSPQGASIRGSAYAYVVGLVAGFIGWGILGAMEGVLGGILDASVVCWGSERGAKTGRSYCLEAEYLFGDGRERDFS
ncbi:hypothetical protein K3495_g4252 [Podosphaera aphanis]|nr:hypothetical protein K3495_g4252 [Podosphaera aphanis]